MVGRNDYKARRVNVNGVDVTGLDVFIQCHGEAAEGGREWHVGKEGFTQHNYC